MKRIIFLFLTCCSLSLSAQTPMLSNQGALISVKGNAFVAVHGDVRNDNDGTFHNSNEIHAFGDWENNASNEAFVSTGEGIVHLQGANQTIKGSSITRFYDLRLENTGVKYATIDVYVGGFLRLNSREFNLDTNTTHVFNPSLNAVQHNQSAGIWGFVSSLVDGGLLRHTNSANAYFYPVGSTLNTARFRPVNITPTTNANAAFKVRMANDDATNEGWDRSLSSLNVCEVNPYFFHRISKMVGTQDATVEIYYDLATESGYDDLAKWSINALWDAASQGNLGATTPYNLSKRVSAQPINDFYPNPFALARLSPEISLDALPNPTCSNVPITLTATSSAGAFSNYDFFVDSVLVQSGTSDTYILNNPRAGNVPLWVVGRFPECGDESDTVALTVLQGVNAMAYSDTIIVAGTNANLLATGGDFYSWFPDSALSCAICPATTASPAQTTTYWVEVENMDGCKDSVSILVEVQPNINQILFIPNVLTPNGDGFNDTWFIKNIHLFPQTAITIVNRWGDAVYQSNRYGNDWDGNYSGGKLPAGTYYYILDVGGQWGVLKGDVTIIRE